MVSRERSGKRQNGKAERSKDEGAAAANELEDIAHLVGKIGELAARREPDFFELADELAKAKERHPQAFGKIIGGAKVSRRRAYYLLEVRERFQPFMHDAARLRAIGWTKLTVLAQDLDAENAEERLSMAEKVSAHQLRQWLGNDTAPIACHCVLLRFTLEQYSRYKEAILSNGGKPRGRQLVNQEQALMNVIDRLGAHSD